MILSILPPGTYKGSGVISHAELKSSFPFIITWTVLDPLENTQIAIQRIEIQGSGSPLENRFTFHAGGEVTLLNSELGETKGTWFLGKDHISWELNHPPLFEGFELLRLGEGGEFLFHAEYISSASRNEISGKVRRVE